ncbi:MAG: CvfD/Ygs/GSP13 family RNA-binding post-transcriptional regulator [Erysipelotrichaceae bacterium]|nr:CvfD/Ygs/GSP13 family RNA-binding post-transcriptional regulator [Erysipelotrichaceae bacterium]MDY6034683.1 CvfD/Ygs/GSP13 family RNA-binding post-transcriptional regulator [Bulleidia sp.]
MIYKPGQIVEGKITGIQPYGAFVALEHHVSGLIHISEISDGFVKDISKFVNVGDSVKLKVLECDEKHSHVKLSLKALQKTHTRNRCKPVGHKPSLPLMDIGFQSIAEHMNEWIKEAKENILK